MASRKNIEAEDMENEEALPKLTKAEKLGFFQAYQKQDDAVQKAEEAVLKAKVKRSELCEEIRVNCGTGPFQWKSQEISIFVRGETTFFKARTKKTVESIG